jgi:hypothetical protein
MDPIAVFYFIIIIFVGSFIIAFSRANNKEEKKK